MTTTMDLEGVRARLIEELGALRARSEASEGDRSPVILDQQSVGRLSRMDALQGQAMAQATEERRQQRAEQIEAALERVDAGDYGVCVICGEEIAEKRLELDPAVLTCVTCASRRS